MTTENQSREREALATVLIIADDVEFASTITGRWQLEREVPTFTLMGGDLCPGISPASFEMAIVGEVRPGILPSVLTILESSGRPVVFLASEPKAEYAVRQSHPKVMVLSQYEGWLDALLLIASQLLRAATSEQRALAAEKSTAVNQVYSTLGRYILEKRNFLDDALTSILGNAELIIANPANWPEEAREQIETIRNMALRVHEVMQRFSSIEAELHYAEKYTQQQVRLRERSVAAGS